MHDSAGGLGDGRLLNYSVPDLKLREEYLPEKYSEARFVCASPDGKWIAVVFHNAELYLLNVEDPQEPDLQLADVKAQGEISAAAFTPPSTLLVADRTKRVIEYEMGSCERIKDYSPPLSFVEKAFYYAIEPIYKLFPKPSEMDNTIRYALSQEETVGDAEDLQAMRGAGEAMGSNCQQHDLHARHARHCLCLCRMARVLGEAASGSWGSPAVQGVRHVARADRLM